MLSGLADDGRNPIESRALRRPPATLSGDKLEKPVFQRADDDGLNNAVLANGIGEFV